MVSYRTTREAGTRLTFSHLSPSAGLSYSPKPRPALARSLLRGKVPRRRSCCEAQCQTQETTRNARGYGVLWEEMQQFTVSSGRGSRHEKACKGISVRFVPAPRLGPPLPQRSAGRGGKASQRPGEECELPVCPGGSGCAKRRLGSASPGRRASVRRDLTRGALSIGVKNSRTRRLLTHEVAMEEAAVYRAWNHGFPASAVRRPTLVPQSIFTSSRTCPLQQTSASFPFSFSCSLPPLKSDRRVI
jgi:hypothetical protein